MTPRSTSRWPMGASWSAEQRLVAAGRRVDLAEIGADVLGVEVATARSLPTDEHLRVTDGVWAIGDVTGRGAVTHVAMYQARIAAADILGEAHTPADYTALPRVTFTDPEVGSVGLTAAAARAAGLDVAVGRVDVASTARGWLHTSGNEASSRSSRTVGAGSSSAPRRWARPAARSSACSPWPSTHAPRSRSSDR